MLRLAVPSDGALHEPALDFLSACGLGVRRSSLRRYTAEVPALPGVVVHFQRGSDIGLKVDDGSADMGLIGRDRFLETRRENGDTIVVADNLGFGQSDLVIGVPDGWLDVSSMADLAELSMEFRERGKDLRIATKYPRLVETFLLSRGVSFFSLVESSGTLEAAPVMGYADIIADISSTGTTLRENRLKTIDGGSVISSEACLIANGALVLALDTDFDGCMAIVQRLSQDEGIYLANSMNSLRLEGQKTVAIEIVQQLDWTIPDVVIIPGGNLGNVSALGAGFDMMGDLGLINRQPQIVVAQAEAANPLYLAYQRNWEFEPVGAKPTQASAIQIGNPVSVRKAIRTLRRHRGIVEQASEAELAEASARADRTGMYNCPHTGVALAALIKLRERGQIDAGARVVVISTASGLKFTDFKLGYHERRLPDVPAAHANVPVELPDDYDAVRRAIDEHSAGQQSAP